jgi:solute carrier family 32 (vesicular inhibitory amino acid transporter)
MDGHPAVPTPNVSLEQVATTFGNLALAYGAAIIIPSLQRHHKQPERMPFVIGTTMVIITVLFVALAWLGYSAVGCQISGNLLFNVFPNAKGVSSLGMKANFGAAVIAYLFMQLHITIAFAVLLYPASYLAERVVLGMHKSDPSVMDEDLSISEQEDGALAFRMSETPKDLGKESVDAKPASHDEEDEYKGGLTVFKYVVLRLAIVAVLVVIAVVLQDKFIDLSDFVGASANTFCCILLPIVFYMKKLGHKMPLYERAAAVLVLVVCTVLGVYVTYKSGKKLFSDQTPGPNHVAFPFCKAEHQATLYYIKP